MSQYVFNIFIPAQSAMSVPAVQQLATLALILGCDPDVLSGGANYPFNQDGINMVGSEHLLALIQLSQAGVISCAGQVGPRYIEMTDAEYNGLVPVDFPESVKHVGVEPDITVMQMTFAEYCPWAAQSVDKSKWLVDLSERAEGETCGDGTSWDEYLIWASVFGERILSSSQAAELRASEVYA